MVCQEGTMQEITAVLSALIMLVAGVQFDFMKQILEETSLRVSYGSVQGYQECDNRLECTTKYFCSCQDNCLKTGSCCLDSLVSQTASLDAWINSDLPLSFFLDERLKAMRNTTPNFATLSCQPVVPWLQHSRALTMIHNCPPDVLESDRRKCEVLYPSLESYLPVQGMDQFIYRNRYCAACHNTEVDIFLNIIGSCATELPGPSSQNFSALFSTQRNCTADILLSRGEHYALPYCDASLRRGCDISSPYYLLCNAYIYDIQGFANPHCLLCSRYNSSNVTVKEHCPDSAQMEFAYKFFLYHNSTWSGFDSGVDFPILDYERWTGGKMGKIINFFLCTKHRSVSCQMKFPCSCHETCHLIGNCCIDQAFLSSPLQMFVHPKLLNFSQFLLTLQNQSFQVERQARCVPLILRPDPFFRTQSLLLIQSCSSSVEAIHFKLCTGEMISDIQFIPVIGDNSYMYRNQYCALCNKVVNYTFMTLEGYCPVPPSLQNNTKFEEVLKDCSVAVNVPAKYEEYVHPCEPNIKKSCPAQNIHYRLCNTYYMPYKNFFNPHCALCNSGDETHEDSHGHDCQSNRGPYQARYSYTISFSNSEAEMSEICVDITENALEYGQSCQQVSSDVYGTPNWLKHLIATESGINITGSSVGLAVYLFIFYKRWKQRTTANLNLLSLVCNLFFSDFMLLLIAMMGQVPKACYVIAILLHWVLLEVLTWTGIICYDLYVCVNSESPNRENLKMYKKYALLAFSIPTIVVSTAAAVDSANVISINYGMDGVCWIGNVWARIALFIIPEGLLLLTCGVSLLLTVRQLADTRQQLKQNLGETRAKFSISKVAMKSICLLGLAEVLSFVQIPQADSHSEIVFNAISHFIFTVVRSFRGLLIFLVMELPKLRKKQ